MGDCRDEIYAVSAVIFKRDAARTIGSHGAGLETLGKGEGPRGPFGCDRMKCDGPILPRDDEDYGRDALWAAGVHVFAGVRHRAGRGGGAAFCV